jgi:predicted NBD/HSP70 family sugar kinase
MPRQPGATQDEIRRRNLSTLLHELHVHGARSRAELTGSMGLNRSTIKALVGELVERDLVSEVIPDTAVRAGRPSHVVVPRSETVHVLAAELGVDTTTVAVVGLGGAILARRQYVSESPSPVEETVDRLSAELIDLQSQVGGRLVGVGVAVPGLVQGSDGWVELAPNLGWREVPFGELLTRRLGLGVPVKVGNDGDVGGLAEHLRGAGQGTDNLLYVSGDVGVGGGIILDGRIMLGACGYAGEIGHMMVNPGGRRCRCGSCGCFETEVGEEAILVACGRPPDAGRVGLREVFAAATRGEPTAVAGLHEIVVWLARGLASLVNVLDTELVILGGTLAGLLPAAGPRLKAELASLTTLTSRHPVPVVASGLGEDSAMVGAAELAFEPLIANPLGPFEPPRELPPPTAPDSVGAASQVAVLRSR